MLSLWGLDIHAETPGEYPSLSAEKVEIPTRYLKSVIVASETFKTMQPTADLKNYMVWVYKVKEGVSVAFFRELIVEKGPPLHVSKKGGEGAGRGITITVNNDTGEVISALYMH
jgi:hypothetical protein